MNLTSTSPKRVVSKRTKALFIAFGAASIATICIVYTADIDTRPTSASAAARHAVHTPAPK